MKKELLTKIIRYLDDDKNLKWSTSATVLSKLGISYLQPLELDEILIQYVQENKNCEIRCSTLPSKLNLNVLWGSLRRIKKRDVPGIYKQDQEILIDDLDRVNSKNLFLSHSFKDLKLVIELSKKLIDYNIYTWLAETEILKHDHINHTVQDAIENLPFFGVLITHNVLASIWSAKEIGFALNNKKQIFGFLHTESEELYSSINDSSFTRESSIGKEIYRKFFDNKSNVKFLLYPESANVSTLSLKEIDGIIDWSYLHGIATDENYPS